MQRARTTAASVAGSGGAGNEPARAAATAPSAIAWTWSDTWRTC